MVYVDGYNSGNFKWIQFAIENLCATSDFYIVHSGVNCIQLASFHCGSPDVGRSNECAFFYIAYNINVCDYGLKFYTGSRMIIRLNYFCMSRSFFNICIDL